MAIEGSAGKRSKDAIYGKESPENGKYSASETARTYTVGDEKPNSNSNWGKGASRSLYSVFSNGGGNEARNRDLLKSRLWKGVPQLSIDQLKAFEAAYTGHQFLFVIDVPKFMTTGIYADTNMHQHMKNLKAVIERASTGFSGMSPIQVNFDTMQDGNGRKMDYVTSVVKENQSVSIKLHEFRGLPVRNALEAWVTGIYDYRSEHGSYHGNLGIPGGWCAANHTMQLLVVQVDPSWTEIQDAAFYYNMVPEEVPFDMFSWTKGEHEIVPDYDISFRCNEERSPAVMYAAEKYMNARILTMVETSVFNSRQFNVFGDYNTEYINAQHTNEAGGSDNIIDEHQYNIKITNTDSSKNSMAEDWANAGNGSTNIEYYDKHDVDNIVTKTADDQKQNI